MCTSPNPLRRPALLLALIIAAAAAPAFATAPFEIIDLPDAQFYNKNLSPNIFSTQTQWIVDHKTSENIVFASQLGDITDDGSNLAYWAAAHAGTDTLNNASVPYAVAFGNHDVHWDPIAGNGIANCKTYYGDSTHQGGSTYLATAPSGLAFAQTISASGYNILQLSLNFSPDANTLAWAKTVIDAHPNMPTIVSTHSYLNVDGSYTPEGSNVWTGLVNNNPQIFMVLCGHMHGQSTVTSTDSAGKKVAQLLIDSQDDPNGGNGWMRKIIFDPDAGKITLTNFSPTYVPGTTTGPDRNGSFSYAATFSSGTITLNGLNAPPPTPGASLTGSFTQDFTTLGTTSGTALPTGWKVYGLAGNTSTFTAAARITPAAIAAATLASSSTTLWNQGTTVPKAQDTAYNVGTAAGDTNRFLAASPTLDAATVFELTLTNNTARPLPGLTVAYDMKVFALGSTGGTEASELPGYAVFYSLDGTTWTEAPSLELTNTSLNSLGHASAYLDFSATPLQVGYNLYIRWADDNNVANSPDQIFGLDNITVTAPVPEPATLGLLVLGTAGLLLRRRHP